MNDILILISKEDNELINMIKNVKGNVKKIEEENFDGDPSFVAFLITITPAILKTLEKIIKIISSDKTRGKIKIKGIEIEGFTFDETMQLLRELTKKD